MVWCRLTTIRTWSKFVTCRDCFKPLRVLMLLSWNLLKDSVKNHSEFVFRKLRVLVSGAEVAVVMVTVKNWENTNACFLLCGAQAVLCAAMVGCSVPTPWSTVHVIATHQYFLCAQYLPSALPHCYCSTDKRSYRNSQDFVLNQQKLQGGGENRWDV